MAAAQRWYLEICLFLAHSLRWGGGESFGGFDDCTKGNQSLRRESSEVRVATRAIAACSSPTPLASLFKGRGRSARPSPPKRSQRAGLGIYFCLPLVSGRLKVSMGSVLLARGVCFEGSVKLQLTSSYRYVRKRGLFVTTLIPPPPTCDKGKTYRRREFTSTPA